jgi:hypothetical protein
MKKFFAAAFVLMFVATIATTSFAAKIKCEVESVDGEKVILNCGDKADKFKEGDKLRVPTASKGAAVEGC